MTRVSGQFPSAKPPVLVWILPEAEQETQMCGRGRVRWQRDGGQRRIYYTADGGSRTLETLGKSTDGQFRITLLEGEGAEYLHPKFPEALPGAAGGVIFRTSGFVFGGQRKPSVKEVQAWVRGNGAASCGEGIRI